MSGGEEKLLAQQRHVETLSKAIESKLGQLDGAIVKGKAPSTDGVKGGSITSSAELETTVQNLRRQVFEEYDHLQKHQKELAHAKPAIGGSLSRNGEVEEAVKELSKQVADE